MQLFKTTEGCDSTVTLHLTINYPKTSEFSATVCSQYQWNDSTYTTSGDYVQPFKTTEGCDSTVTLHLTINYPKTSEFSATALQPVQVERQHVLQEWRLCAAVQDNGGLRQHRHPCI